MIAVLELRSNSMRLGIYQDTLAGSLAKADRILIQRPAKMSWDLEHQTRSLGDRCRILSDAAAIIADLVEEARRGDRILIMSNGDFEGLHGRLIQALRERDPSPTGQ